MKIETIPTEFEHARPIMRTIEAAGFEAYFVGGSVRDTLLHKPIHDVDIATSAYPEEIKKLFHKTVDTGIEHGTIMILDHGIGYETTTFRTESTYQDYRRPDSVTFVRSLKEDLNRRDFTINALAMRENGEIIDLFDGLTDLDNGIIRAVGDAEARFNEDALRMMRAVRFASQLDFNIEANTELAIANHAPLLKKIAVERIQVEFEKMLMGRVLNRGLVSFISSGLYQYCPGLADSKAALTSLATIADVRLSNPIEVWTILCFLLGLDQPKSRAFLKSWKSANQLIEVVGRTLHALKVIEQREIDDWLLYITGPTALKSALNLAITLGIQVDRQTVLDQYESLQITTKKQLAITGQDLMAAGITPGPKMGEILASIEHQVVENKLTNNKDELMNYIRHN